MTRTAVHVPDEYPRYLTVDERPVFLIGATYPDGWYPITDPGRDFLPELDRLADVVRAVDSPHVAGLVRVIPYFSGVTLQPWSYDDKDDVYDLDEFDPRWERRLRSYLQAATDRDLVVALELWDDWSITRGVGGAYDPGPEQAWNAHPFNPENNVNYDGDALPTTTRECGAPFYSTVPENAATSSVLECQRRYAAHYADIVADYPTVLCSVSNESRAHLQWSRYWADFLRDAIDPDRLVGDMPSTSEDGTGECDSAFSPTTLLDDDQYDYVDCSQALSRHSFGSDRHDLITGVKERVGAYARQMDASGSVKPILVSKDYTNTAPDGRAVAWSKFVAGTASFRFHRHGVSVWDEVGSDDDVTFAFDTIQRLGQFVAETAFWRHRAPLEVITETPDDAVALARGEPGAEYVVAVIDGSGGDIAVDIEPGSYDARWYDCGTGVFSLVNNDGTPLRIAGESLQVRVPEGAETQVLHVRRATSS
ncbi:hypothetical protein [Haloarchaeobius sp. TZWSO28]|uniref:hypothetical protein n=1 Tax=Haloarchaeobius sp. TZWSO28 TaxID=3446119 RepID=UPI003EBD1EB4